MSSIKEILQVGIFKDHFFGGCKVIYSGLVSNGYSVEQFDYREISQIQGQEQMNALLLDRSRGKDLVLVGKGELIYPETLATIRRNSTHTALWYGDMRDKIPEWLKNLMPEVDTFFLSSGGEVLRQFHREGKPGASAYYFNPAMMPDDFPNEEAMEKTYNIVFTGTPYGFAGPERIAVMQYLVKRGDAAFRGGGEQLYFNNLPILPRMANKILLKVGIRRTSARVRGMDYLKFIRSGKIGIGIDGFLDIPKYSSDRLIHFLESGTFYLARSIPLLDELFKVGEELETFTSLEELDAKVEFYLKRDDIREKIARQGRERAFRDYNNRRVTSYMIDIIRDRKSDLFENWEIVK